MYELAWGIAIAGIALAIGIGAAGSSIGEGILGAGMRIEDGLRNLWLEASVGALEGKSPDPVDE